MRKDFDYTMMSTFQTCRRRYNYRINRGLVPKEKAMPLTFGGAIHQALDYWHMSQRTREDCLRMIEIFKANFQEDLERDSKRTVQMGEWVLRNYASTYAMEPFKVVASEQEFVLELPNGNNFIGRIDKIVNWDGMFWVVDHKTTSSMGYQFGKKTKPNMQLEGYVWAARELGYHAVGVLVDAILVAKGLLQATSRAKLTPLARFDNYVSEETLNEWYHAVENIQEDIKRCEESGVWYPNYDACTYYGECPYRNLCIEDTTVREKRVELDYNVEHWSPIKEDTGDAE